MNEIQWPTDTELLDWLEMEGLILTCHGPGKWELRFRDPDYDSEAQVPDPIAVWAPTLREAIHLGKRMCNPSSWHTASLTCSICGSMQISTYPKGCLHLECKTCGLMIEPPPTP